MKSIVNQVILVLFGAIIVVGFSFNSFEDPDGKKLFETHKKPFKGTDEELQALVDWLLEQKVEE